MCSRSSSVSRSISAGNMTTTIRSPRKRSEFPGSLTDLHRYRKTVHGHDGDSRIVMVRKTDERTFASIESGKEPLLETITRETIETFRGQRTELKVTTEKKERNDKLSPDLVEALGDYYKKSNISRRSVDSANKRFASMDFEKDFLKAHNDYREKHGVPPLKLNSEISKVSQAWADHLLRKNVFQHSNNKKYGENLYFKFTAQAYVPVSGDEPVRTWYDEIKKYTFGDDFSHETGHFTQVVWKGSREVGVGVATAHGRAYIVANYYPPGNFLGEFAENVLPPKKLLKEANNNESLGRSLEKLNISNKSNRLTPTHSRRRSIEGTEGNFEEDFLNAHNEYRARHGVPPLQLDRKMCKYAEEWAKLLSSKNMLEHRKNCPYGENIYSMYSSDPQFKITGRTPVDAWYEEMKYHTFGKEPNSLKTGHFTQIVWKTSEFLGVGVAKSRHGSIYVVANYSPAGNFVGSFSENVPPLISSSDNGTKEGASTISSFRVVSNPSTSESDIYTKFQLDALKAHNDYRRKHGVPEMTLSKELCDFAKEWADHCLKHDLGLRSNNPYGENLVSISSSDSKKLPDAKDIVDSWYKEISMHDFNKESLNYNTLHFTQIIWKETKELGIAVAQNERGKAVVVANYNPRGNVYGQFKLNVFKPKI